MLKTIEAARELVKIRDKLPRILALDLMSNLGYCCRADDGSLHYGTETFLSKQRSSDGLRYLKFRNWLKQMHETIRPSIVFFEEVRGFPPKNCGRDSRVYYAFESHLLSFCESARLDHQGVTPGTIKKFIAGHGNASKKDVMLAVQTQGYRPGDDNQSDAIALLLYAESIIL